MIAHAHILLFVYFPASPIEVGGVLSPVSVAPVLAAIHVDIPKDSAHTLRVGKSVAMIKLTHKRSLQASNVASLKSVCSDCCRFPNEAGSFRSKRIIPIFA